jgi:uncharacterized RDD family membrane protein YckC
MHGTVSGSTDAVSTSLQTPAQSATSWIVDPDAVSSTLSKRGTRLTAFLIDQAIGITAFWLAGRVTGAIAFLSYIGLFGVSVFQIILLGTRGQTIGKMVLRIAIVDRFDKTSPGFVRAALIRQLPLMVISVFTPAFALVYLIVDGLPMFFASRRCIHDRLAGTIVIDVPQANAFFRS